MKVIWTNIYFCSGELAPLFLTTLLGLSNGLWGSLPMILAPAALPEHQVAKHVQQPVGQPAHDPGTCCPARASGS
jgi:hypothetical protein